ncbi:sensor histidine kinase [Desulfovibrio oxyclinae]|uniref:sensor histidine kinase n=1 Tax=Desulfovibrio oxyclinae TaxID=63560 RepID=UPI000366D1CE|nr:HAMP domain-containing sensor histidine kinase [Desulfovibrio oxyclinae]
MARRISISNKLLLWSLLLVTIFFVTSGWLILRVSENTAAAEDLVARNHEIGVAARQMAERLESVQENIRRFTLLGAEEAVDYVVEDIDRFGEILRDTLDEHPEMNEEWAPLTEEFSITIDQEGPPDKALEPNPTIRKWLGVLNTTLERNRSEMQRRLRELERSGRTAMLTGIWGLVACFILGTGGSLFLAWRLNRSLREIRRGIREVRTGGLRTPVRVATRDELAELGSAFNRMGARLRAEERMRAEFVSMLSHEIRTPLTTIRESLNMIREGVFGEINERQAKFIDISQQQAGNLSDLLEKLMTVSRLESGRLTISPEPTDGSALLEEVAESLLPAASQAGIELETSVTAPRHPVRADAGRIRQVLTNLGDNAVKFSPSGSRVVLTLTPSNGGAEFAVQDHGPGIPEEEQDLVFDKYYRSEGVREQKNGAGLGLAICRKIVEAHGSTLHLHCPEGEGCRFSFVLPPAINEQE